MCFSSGFSRALVWLSFESAAADLSCSFADQTGERHGRTTWWFQKPALASWGEKWPHFRWENAVSVSFKIKIRALPARHLPHPTQEARETMRGFFSVSETLLVGACLVPSGTHFLLASVASRGGAVRGAESLPRREQQRLLMFTACTRSHTHTNTHTLPALQTWKIHPLQHACPARQFDRNCAVSNQPL